MARQLRTAAALVVCLALAACKVDLYSNLNEREANEMLAALTSESIPAEKEAAEGGLWQLKVEESRLPAALDVLRAQGLPHDRYASMGDVFQKQGLVSTPSEERMRYIYAVSQELSQTLRTIDGVVAARVHVVIPANDPLSDKLKPSSAAVFIKYRPDVDLRLLAPTVKDMVAHSIEGLSHDQVSLSLVEAKRSSGAVQAAADAPQRYDVAGLSLDRTVITLGVLLLAAVACLIALPGLLRRQGLDWRTWARRQLLKR
ncbi:type III secretion protein J [Pelomonas saccharophila]|uniref:Lipoprotein n=1 Tax=Roseateles saccharophilus TaxID=304 RepID=A0ABU1YIA8_ROSSA|nr:type III secretion inner membrane ring lipoprotein SctJ [Roseateles saccharophilus]MDR7267951.1 type III secretion protein J [Roseateles saccharophilus]